MQFKEVITGLAIYQTENNKATHFKTYYEKRYINCMHALGLDLLDGR